MKRYALFFVFIGIQTTLSLSTSIEEYAKEKFEKKCNKILPTKDVSKEVQDAVFAFKDKCWQEGKHNFEGLSDEQAKKEVQKQVALCLAKHTQAKLEVLFDKDITFLQDKDDPEYEMHYNEIFKLAVLRVVLEKIKKFQKIEWLYKKSLGYVGNKRNCIHLFDGTLEQNINSGFERL